MNVLLEKFIFPKELEEALNNSPSVIVPDTKEMLYDLIFGNESTNRIDVLYDVNGETKKEVDVVRCKNGAVVNYTEDYMRRRDPDCMRIADSMPTDKPRFKDVYGYDFKVLKKDTFQWLGKTGTDPGALYGRRRKVRIRSRTGMPEKRGLFCLCPVSAAGICKRRKMWRNLNRKRLFTWLRLSAIRILTENRYACTTV